MALGQLFGGLSGGSSASASSGSGVTGYDTVPVTVTPGGITVKSDNTVLYIGAALVLAWLYLRRRK